MGVENILHIDSISQLHTLLGYEKPSHPLITIVDVAQLVIPDEFVGLKIVSRLYSIALKDKSCGMQYGRHSYDFNEGVLIFTAPDQVQAALKPQQINEVQGWMLFFHPDLIRNTTLGKVINTYHFFSYDVHEALHLSDSEQKTLSDCIDLIKREIAERIDNHSQVVISNSLELILNLSRRFYERQFNTRSAENSDVISTFEQLLREYYESGLLRESGVPSIEYFSDRVHLSPNYFSDLLKKHTGLNAKDHINNFIVDKAKNLLMGSTDSISGVAYELGFNYPHYFARFFKNKTGMTPQEYRSLN